MLHYYRHARHCRMVWHAAQQYNLLGQQRFSGCSQTQFEVVKICKWMIMKNRHDDNGDILLFLRVANSRAGTDVRLWTLRSSGWRYDNANAFRRLKQRGCETECLMPATLGRPQTLRTLANDGAIIETFWNDSRGDAHVKSLQNWDCPWQRALKCFIAVNWKSLAVTMRVSTRLSSRVAVLLMAKAPTSCR